MAKQNQLRLGVATLVETAMPELTKLARTVEECGYSHFWVPDERLLRNVYVCLATIANATSQIGLSTGVTNPYTRHPAHTAAAIATIDELSGGRASLALGAGGGLETYGLEHTQPVHALREAVEIVQQLTAGETVTMTGKRYALRDAHLDFQPLRPVPVYLASRGPRILQLAGEVADGVVIGGFAQAGGISYAQEHVQKGLTKAGRPASAVDQMSWLYVSAAPDRLAAREAVSKIVLASLITSRPILDQIGVDLPPNLRAHLDASGWRYPKETPKQAAELLPDHMLDAFAVYGTPEECVAKLQAIRACGIDHMTFVLFPAAGQTLTSLTKLLAAEVLPALQA
ncbi:MAG: LLM class flavin-dependent oxidoreductase [Micrococcales bacterium]|nr:LLM class flavin-dependent oxidoreductase [Micrococcales bacterium]